MELTQQQKYEIAKEEQRLKAKRRELFSQVPGSVEHAVKLVVVDRICFELDCLKRKIAFQNKRTESPSTSKAIENLLTT